jgi:hypothetical protein
VDKRDLNNFDPYLTGELVAAGSISDETSYFNSEWLSGNIYLSDGAVIKNKLIKYNGFLDELFWMEPNSGNVIKLDKEAIQQFHFLSFNGDTSVYFRKIKGKRNIIADSSNIFEQVVYEGTVSLYVIRNYKIERTEFIRINGIGCEKSIYAEEPVYIFRSGTDKIFVTKRLNRHSLYSFSPGNKDMIKDFFRINRSGDPGNNAYLRKLTQFLSTVINQ